MQKLRSLFCLGLLCLLIYLYGLGFLAYALYAAVGLLVTSRLMAHHALTGVEHSRTLGRRRADIGDRVTVSVEVTNNKGLPVLWALMEDTIPERLPTTGDRVKAAMMGAKKTVLMKYEVECAYRGYHQFGPLVLESGDLFGMVRRFRTGRTADYLTVLPKVVPIARYGVHTHRPIGELRIQTRIYEDPTRMAGVREYVRGDSLNRIHWKATARTGVLHSKVYDPTTMIGANVVLDFHVEAYEEPDAFEARELAATTAASVAAFILEQKQQVGFLSNGRDAIDRIKEEREEVEATSRAEARRLAQQQEESDRLRPVEVASRRGDGQIEQILVTLARLELSDGFPLAKMLLSEYSRLPRDAALVVITGKVPDLLVQVLAEVKHSGFVVAVFVIRNHIEWEKASLRLEAEGIACHEVRDEADLIELAVRTI